MQPETIALVVHPDATVRSRLCGVLFEVLAPSRLVCSAYAMGQQAHLSADPEAFRVALIELAILDGLERPDNLLLRADVLMALAQAPTHADWCAGRVAGADMVLDTLSPEAELASLIQSALDAPGLRRRADPDQSGQNAWTRTPPRALTPHGGLTSRQHDVLERIREGHTNQMIARELGISENTVRLHVSAILKALCVPNRTAAALWPRPQAESA